MKKLVSALESVRTCGFRSVCVHDLLNFAKICDYKFDKSQQKIELSFKTTFKSKLDKIIVECQNAHLNKTKLLSADDFLPHPNLTLIQVGHEVVFAAKKDFNLWNYSVYDSPLRKCKFRLEVLALNEKNRLLGIWVAKKSEVDCHKDKMKSGRTGVSLIGYNGMKLEYCNMTGAYISRYDKDGIKVGTVLFLEFDVAEKSLKIYTEDKKIDLASNEICSEDYYLVHGLHDPLISVLLERLE